MEPYNLVKTQCWTPVTGGESFR